MTTYVALLRAVNVAGTNKLPMSELKSMCASSGFSKPRTYIASGNVIFESHLSESSVKARLQSCLASYAGRPVDVIVRTASEMAAVLARNPFKSAVPNRTVAIFLDGPPVKDALHTVTGRRLEEVALGVREIYVNYVDGMGTSKLKIPAASRGTARNMNTVAKLSELAGGGDRRQR
jgi:uncharacterized protein (DUF1697 family)